MTIMTGSPSARARQSDEAGLRSIHKRNGIEIHMCLVAGRATTSHRVLNLTIDRLTHKAYCWIQTYCRSDTPGARLEVLQAVAERGVALREVQNRGRLLLVDDIGGLDQQVPAPRFIEGPLRLIVDWSRSGLQYFMSLKPT